MKRSVNHLIGYVIRANDGDIGNVEEFYFDDHYWTVRYLVVNTGGWLSGRRVLLSPDALRQPEWESRRFPVALTMEQVRDSPDLDTEKPVSRQHETGLHKHNSRPLYWEVAPYVSGLHVVLSASPMYLHITEEETGSGSETARQDPHLRSTRRVTGYHIQADDGEIGHVEDFIIDDLEWDIRFLVVKTRNFLPARKVLVAPQWIARVSGVESKVFTALSRDAVRNGPVFVPSEPFPGVP